MTKPTVEPAFGTWSAPEVRLSIEYAVDLMEEIRAVACEGLQQLAHGGLEIGGVLFGVQAGDSIRILKWRPISCEHAEGPTMRLSTRDRIALTRQMEASKDDADLAGMKPVGLFVSHCRSDIFLNVSDLETYNGFFSEPWQVALVLRPSRPGSARAGFFAREADGALKSDSSYRDFTIEPTNRPAARFVERRATPRRNLPIAPMAKPEARQTPRPEPVAPKIVEPPQFTIAVKPAPAPKGQWLWAIPGCLAVLILAVVLYQKFAPVVNPPFAFRAFNAGTNIQVEWDANSESVRRSRRATLEMKTGAETKQYPISAAELRGGKLTYPGQSSDVELRMTVYPSRGPAVEEFARLVGPGSASPAGDREALEAEIARLKEELRRERLKNKKSAEK